MNRIRKTILGSLTIFNALHTARVASTLPLLTQVTHSQSSSTSPLNILCSVYSHKVRKFSSKPSSLVELLLKNDWSSELKTQLENSAQELTHETVIYVLKRLDREPEKAWRFFNWVSERECGHGFRLSSTVYSLMLRILVNEDSLERFWIMLKKMEGDGFSVDDETYRTIKSMLKSDDAAMLKNFRENATDVSVKEVVSVILEGEWSDKVEKKLEEMNLVVTDNVVVRAMKELKESPSKALMFFFWVGGRKGYEHNTVTYNAILKTLGWAGSMGEFWSVFEEMKNVGFEMDIDTYVKISRQIRKQDLREDAVKLYELMMDGPYMPPLIDCVSLLLDIAGCPDPDVGLALRVVKKYDEAGNPASKAVYDGLHRSLTGAGKFDEAEKVVNDMRKARFEPDNVTYSQLMYGLCKANKLEEAYKVLNEMEASGCTPDVKTWTILIKGHCTANQVDKALLLFAKMIERNMKVDADLLEVLVNGLIDQDKVEAAHTLLVEMVNKENIKPWQATYKKLIKKLVEAKKFEETINLLPLMKKHGYPPYCVPVIQYIGKSGSVDHAISFLEAIKLKNDRLVSMHCHVLKAFFKEGRYSDAQGLLHKSPYHIRKHPKVYKLFGSDKRNNGTAA